MRDILTLLKQHALEYAGIATLLLTVAGLVEKFFGVTSIGTKFFKYSRKLALWLLIPFEPINVISHLLKRIANLEVTMLDVKREVSYNGGSSMKDAVKHLQNEGAENKQMLAEILLRMNAADEWDNRMIFRTDKLGQWTMINRAFLRQFGWIEQDVEGWNWENIIEQQDLANVREKWERAIENKSSFRDEVYILTADNNAKLCLVQASPICTDKELKGFYGTIEIIK